MAIDYRKEVDSGNDQKRIVESCLINLLKDGVPEEVIKEMPLFNKNHPHHNPRHLEMIENLKRGYKNKEEQILEIYGGYSQELSEQIVPDRFAEVSHPVGGELYPMDKNETIEKFKERDACVKEIEKLKILDIKNLEKEKNKIINAITKYKVKFPLIDRILDALNEIDELNVKNDNDSLKIIDYTIIFKKNGLNPKELSKYNIIYEDYKKLKDYLTEISIKYEMALDGKVRSEEIDKLMAKKNEIETEIVLRNTKLINGFIRHKFKDLLVEQDDLFQICYEGLWKAVKHFDYKQGNNFSTFAYPCMFNEVSNNFKELTTKDWRNYWGKRKIDALLKNTSKTLGRKITIDELVQYGFIDMTEKTAYGFYSMADEYSLSDLFPREGKSYEEYEKDSEYALYFGDDEINDYESGKVEEIVTNYDGIAEKSLIRESLKEVLHTLTLREAKVLRLRYGLEDGIERTLEQVAEIFGLTRERIRQIEAKALRKLRHPHRSKKIKDFLEHEYTEIISNSYNK